MKKPAPSTPPSLPCLPHHPAPGQPSDADELLPPFVSDEVIPLPGAARGLGIRHTMPWMTVNFPRWTSLSPGDTYKFYMGNDRFAIASDEIRAEDLDKAVLRLVILPEHIPEGFTYPTFCEVIRRGSGTPSTSPRETWYVKRTRPGGVSKDPALPYHTELVIHLPPDLVGNVLDPERAKEGVELTIDRYPNITEGDTAEVYWNGHLTILRIDDEHVAGIKPITVLIPESTIIDGGSGDVIIRFRLYDKVFNFSGEVQQWSDHVTVDSDLDPLLLPIPHFVVDGESVMKLNLDTHGDAFFEVEVVIPRRLPSGTLTPAGALIIMTLKGADAEGLPFETTLPAFPARIGLSATAPVDRKHLVAVLNGHMQFEYTLTTATHVPLGKSRRRNITVFGTKSTMPAMIIEQNEGGNIDPAHPFIKVFFPRYTPYDRHYNVTLRMEAVRPGGGLVFYEESALAGQEPPPERYRIVDQEDFARFVGIGTVQVFYLVDDGKVRIMSPGIQTIRKSDVLEVTFGQRDAELPEPQLQYVDEFNNLDPARIKGGQLQVTLPYTRTVPDDIFKWTLLGANSNGSASDEIPLNTGTAGRPVQFYLEEALIVASKNGEIRLSYSLVPASGGGTRYSQVLIVTVGEALDLLRPEVLQAQRYPDQLVPEAALSGATIAVSYLQMLPSHRIQACWTGIPGIGTHCETKDGNTSKTLHFEVPAEVIGASLNGYGRYIEVQYFVLLGVHQTPSPVLSLNLLPPVLPQPYIEGHTSSVLNISTLLGSERAMVDRWSFINRNQRMWFELRGTYANGTDFYATFYNGDPVTFNGEQNGIRPTAPVSEMRQLKDGSQLLMRFGVTFDQTAIESNALWFPERRYTIQAIPAQFPVPTLRQATGSGSSVTLAPLDARFGATVDVSYSPMYVTDFITLEVMGAPGAGSGQQGPINGEADGTVTFNLSEALIAANIGNKDTLFTVKYTVLRNGTFQPSAVLTVTLKAIPQAELKRTLLRIDEAIGGVLDVGELVGNATATVGTWPFIARDQPVWLRLFGNKPNGTAHNLPLLNGADGDRVTDAWLNLGYQQKAILNTYLIDLGNATQLTMQLKAALTSSTDESKAIEFPPVVYSIRSRMINDETTFDEYYFNHWLSQWPNVGIRRETNANYYLQSVPYTGSGVRIYKVYFPYAAGYYRIRFRYKISKFANIGGPTSILVHTRNWQNNVVIPSINTWLNADVQTGFVPGQSFELSISVVNPADGGIYDFDDIKVQQRPYPSGTDLEE
ncbi:hypothetical protein GIW56_16920 [Pseudomonas gessardii]|uniref:Uncharacterized protein n=2 Tax=Pseudomonas gessardii TaxID=78544 RepID=A0ABS9F837_9PSED|nr:hypothetical protein [Pseudomonas gessardii]MCF4990206.1 hypothetical protein [Pseudomonas gessardii]MCF5108526.1 hypothetical protein [Pseudomonas gessardii]